MKSICWLATMLFGLATLAGAGESGVALGAKVGTLGPGLELTTWLVEWLNLRVGGFYLPLHHSGTRSDVSYKADLTFKSAEALLDLHPFLNNFRISGGLLYNQNELTGHGTATQDKKIGDHTYTPEEIGTLRGSLDFQTWCPYLGIGFGDAVGEDARLNFIFDLGIMFQGQPKVGLTADGTSSGDPVFQQDLEQERKDTKDDVEWLQFYPVVAIGLSYQF